jgi:hypothetical protein
MSTIYPQKFQTNNFKLLRHNMWQDFYYRFDSQEQAETMELPEFYAIDHVGIIEGATGWHVNARWRDGVEPENWKPYAIPAPDTPMRVFA